MPYIDFGFFAQLSLLADVFALFVLVGKLFGSVKWPWVPCLLFVLGTWGISFLLFYFFVEVARAV